MRVTLRAFLAAGAACSSDLGFGGALYARKPLFAPIQCRRTPCDKRSGPPVFARSKIEKGEGVRGKERKGDGKGDGCTAKRC